MTFGDESLKENAPPSPYDTIEHLAAPNAFFARLPGLLAPDGVLVASVPTTPSVDLNPHHLHDFTESEFRKMGARNGLVEIASQV